MQHLDGRFEHLDEFQQSLIGFAQAAGIAVGIRIILLEVFELADIDLADQRGDVLVVFVTRFGLRDRLLIENRRILLHHPELRDVTVELFQPFGRPRDS